jgi:hypothetical protein
MSETNDMTLDTAKKVRINHVFSEGMQSNFVSHLVAQHQIDHFVLSFFELWPPLILGDTDEEMRRALNAVDSVDARCVARIIVTPNKMREFIAVMADNLARYDSMARTEAMIEEDE